jgi:hypothetical protein
MKKFLMGIMIAIVLVAGTSFAKEYERIFYEDFETSGWETRVGLYSNYASGKYFVGRVSNKAKGGSYCVRWNLMNDRDTDPILGEDYHCTGNPTAGFDLDDIADCPSDTVVIRYWLRYDASNWESPTSEGLRGKFYYMIEDGTGHDTLYACPNSSGSATAHTWGCNIGTYMNPTWISNNWGCNGYANYSPAECTADGVWHRYDLLLDYKNNHIRVWFDGELVTKASLDNDCANGIWPIHPSWKLSALKWWHAGNTDDSTDGPTGEYACGAQIDEIEIWNCLPSDADDAYLNMNQMP